MASAPTWLGADASGCLALAGKAPTTVLDQGSGDTLINATQVVGPPLAAHSGESQHRLEVRLRPAPVRGGTGGNQSKARYGTPSAMRGPPVQAVLSLLLAPLLGGGSPGRVDRRAYGALISVTEPPLLLLATQIWLPSNATPSGPLNP